MVEERPQYVPETLAQESTTPHAQTQSQQESLRATDPRLQNIIHELFRTHAHLPGGTAGAVRQEAQTGERVGGKSHFRKAIERRRQLRHLLRRTDLSAQDRSIAQQILNDLHAALQEAGFA